MNVHRCSKVNELKPLGSMLSLSKALEMQKILIHYKNV